MPASTKMTGRWPASSRKNSFGSLNARDSRQGMKPCYSSRKCKSPQGTDNKKQLSALRHEIKGMRVSLNAAQERNDALQDSVTQMSRDVSDLVGLIRSGVQGSLAAVHGKMDVLQHNVSVVSETHLPAVIAAVSPSPKEAVQVKSPRPFIMTREQRLRLLHDIELEAARRIEQRRRGNAVAGAVQHVHSGEDDVALLAEDLLGS